MAKTKGTKQEVRERAFEEAYGRLNNAQKQAVDTIEGPVMVIAGPGTGKTQILALRIANILKKTDTSPSSILALTFTESGVASMRGRLVTLMGQDGYRVRVHTFHGFCNEVIRLYPDRFPSIIGRVPLVELDALGIVKTLLDELRPTLLRPHGRPDFYVRDIIGKISEVKREHITPEMLKDRIGEETERIKNASDLYHEKGAHKGKMKGMYTEGLRSLERATEFVDLFASYEAVLAEKGFYDFEDTIIAVIETLAKDGELKLMLQEEHQYILADEHQDANGSQNELLVLLSDFHPEPNLFIVGDEKQAIYRFQGASLENFFSFKRRYARAVLIPLADNYRSTQRILDAAHALIGPVQSQYESERVQLTANSAHEEQDIRCARVADEETEHGYIAETISQCIKEGTPGHEIAILVRRNMDVPSLAAALEKHAVPFVAQGDDPVLSHPVVTGFVTLLEAIATFGNDAFLYPVLALPYSGISNLDIYRLTTAPLYRPGALYATLSDEVALETLEVHGREACKALYALLDTSARALRALPLGAGIERVFAESGCLAYILGQSDAIATLDLMRAFFRYVKALIESHSAFALADLLTALKEAKEYRLSLGGAVYHRENAVMLMTVHRAKGMEFDQVFIPHMHDRLWGARRASERIPLPLFSETGKKITDRVEDDERRLLYVAMTRARKMLTFSYSEASSDGTLQMPSRFLEELKDGYLREDRITLPEEPFFAVPPKTGVQTTLSPEEKIVLRKRLLDQGLSVSALNNYLESPWKYFFVNLLRIPQVKTPHLLYGNAMDETLKWYARKRKEAQKENEVPAVEEVLRVFTNALTRQPLTKKDFETYQTRGVSALAGYLAQYGATWFADSESAVRIHVPFETGIPEFPVITLRGELDKIEHCEENAVRIVDYKTGKPKTRGEIEGTTKTSNGNLKRQLIFYRLLIEGDPIHNWQTSTALLDFVEPDARGKYKREVFTSTESEVTALKETITDTLKAIYTFAFWETPCEESVWDKNGCALVKAIKSRRGFFD